MGNLDILSICTDSLGVQLIGENHIQNMRDAAIVIKYKSGDVIIHQGDYVDKLFYLQSGLVRLYIDSENGEVIFNNVYPGATFCEPAFFKKRRAKVRAIAQIDSVIYKFDRNKVAIHLKENDYIIAMLINSLCNKTYFITSLLENMWNTNCKDRLCNLIYILAKQNLKNEIKITHDELAMMIGTHRITITRSLAKLQGDNLIETARNKIIIKDLKQLEDKYINTYKD